MCAAHKTQLNRTYSSKKKRKCKENEGNKGKPTTTRSGEEKKKLESYAFFLRFPEHPYIRTSGRGGVPLSFKSTLRRRRLCINMRGQYLDLDTLHLG